MSGALRSFYFGQSHVRISIGNDGEPWWLAADVCDVLDLGNPTQALTRLDEDEKSTLISNEGGPGRRIINESGLYSLVLSSRKPEAKPFKKWITSEVLPAIRKTGRYGIQTVEAPKSFAAALRLAADQQDQIEAQQATISVLAPKAAFTDAVEATEGTMSMRDVAQAIGTGQNTLFDFLREEEILMERPRNRPYQEFVNRGYFEVIPQSPWTDRDGLQHIPLKTVVTGKGLVWVQKLWGTRNIPMENRSPDWALGGFEGEHTPIRPTLGN
jgi:prophage antirepressor-like protein